MGRRKKDVAQTGGKSKTDAARMRKHYLIKKYRSNTISPEEIEELAQVEEDLAQYHKAPLKTV